MQSAAIATPRLPSDWLGANLLRAQQPTRATARPTHTCATAQRHDESWPRDGPQAHTVEFLAT
eukprot:785520-Alexandrium_andersonii.AAC.1